MQSVKVTLVDVNPKMVAAWREVFENNPEVTVLQGSMLDQKVSAWVSPTNARGEMAGGLDGVIKKHFGAKIQTRVQSEIARRYQGSMRVGHATCVETGAAVPRFLISTPSMGASSEDISDTLNVALTCAAAFQMVAIQNRAEPGAITSVALPGVGTGTGRTPVEICADLMWTAYNLHLQRDFVDFAEMRAALEEELGALGNHLAPGGTTAAKPAAGVVAHALGGAPAVKGPVIPPKGPVVPPKAPAKPVQKPLDDFDDSE
jgi:O-acetyl-ADP-ribose deacetylase (regulator of RNase III)